MASIVTYGIGNVETQSEISGVQFGIMSADEIRQLSVVECDEITLYNKGVPTPRGILDHRMGTVDRRLFCGTCGQDVRTCPGHWGRIELPLPVFHVAFAETVRKVLNCICHSCSRVRLSEAEVGQLPSIPDGTTQRKQRLTTIYSSCRHKKVCPHCSCPCPVISRSIGNTKLIPDWDHIDDSTFQSEEESEFCKTIVFTPQTAYEMLSFMTDEDVILLGLDPKISHPKNMILHVLLVPPPIIRPSIMVSEGSRARGQDDLTVRLLEIVKRVVHLREILNSTEIESSDANTADVNDAWERLAQDVSVYMHNNPRGAKVATQRSGVPTKCLFSRLKGKQGRFRSNLMGKRVNFSGRSVISPDPLLDVDEVGIPEEMALQLTIQERVNIENIEDLLARVVKGSGRIDGAETVITCDGTSIQLEYCTTRDQIVLQTGWIVERPIRNGDWVLFNRQPTLHRSSLMGHRVVIVSGKTLRCNLAVVSPYNADFDGDEMNVHVPQSPAAIAEVRGIMSVTEQLVSPQAGKPVMGIVQDALLGAHLLTSPDVLLDKQSFMSIILSARQYGKSLEARSNVPPPVYIYPVPLWTGKQLIEVLMPPVTAIYGNGSDIWNAADDDGAISTVASHPLIVRNGKFLSGQFNKSTIGITTGSLVHHVILSAGNKTAVTFMGDVQRVVNRWLVERGFSIGIGDCVPSRTCDTNMRKGIDEAMKRIDTLQTEIPRWSSATLGDGDRGKVSLEKIAVERTIHRMVGRVQMSTGSLVRKEMSHGNGLGAMVLAGSKGNNINICQIMLCVGQNCVNGERIGRDGPDKRTLPGYAQGDASVDGAGFVSNSYLLGLTASEAFFHAKGGREGLVDTSVKTSRTGYIQRRLVKGMESHRVEHDLTVRDASNNIVEFIYGGDGLNPAKLERSEFDAFAKSDQQLHDECIHKSSSAGERKAQENEWMRLLETRNENRSYRIHVLMTKIHKTMDLAVNPRRVLLMTVAQRPSTKRKCNRVSVKTVNSSLDELMEMLIKTFSAQASCNLRLALLYELRSSAIVHTHHLSKSQWDTVLETIKTTILGAIVEAGEMVGCIAAQSIGEPATQMTLNSVDWGTPMVIHWTANEPPPAAHDAEVGAFIDALIEKHPKECQIQPDGVTVYLPLPSGTAKALSPDENGTMMWTELEAVTRHPPINKDGSDTLVEITSESGRQVTVTKGKSLLIERDGKLVDVDGDSVQIGDRVPIVNDLPPAPDQYSLDLHTIFKENEVVFTDVILEAQEAWSNHRRWFDAFKHRSVYSRSDIMRDAVKKRPAILEPGKVFWPFGGSPLPVNIPLDRDFGFFVGAYLAEGCVTEHQVHISNVDEAYRTAASVWPHRHGINSHTTNEKHQKKNNGTSISVMFHSKLLVQLLTRSCGKLSAGKRVPGFALAAPDEFVEGLLDGYISGDGSFSSKQNQLTIHSRSKLMRDGIATLLSRFGIEGRLTESQALNHIEWAVNSDGVSHQRRYGEETPLYGIYVGSRGTQCFADHVQLTISYKQSSCDRASASKRRKRKDTAPRLNSVRLEEITQMKEVKSSHEFVYDLTVASTRNMTCTNGFACRDTFHLAGVAMEGRSQLSGIPRVAEIIDASRNIKTATMTLRIEDESMKSDQQRAEVYARSLEHCPLARLVSMYEVESCPATSLSQDYPDDAILIISKLLCEANGTEENEVVRANNSLRLILNRRLLRRRGLIPSQVLSAILDQNPGTVEGVASSEASIDWIIRLRAIGVTLNADAARVYSHLMETTVVGGRVQIELAELIKSPIVKERDDGGLEVGDELAIEAAGSALGVIAWEPELDWASCTSNDVMDVYATLGIAAARIVIFHELRNLVAGDSSKVNDRHIMMVATSMTHYGTVMPMSRHGINRIAETGPLLRCSFEETSEVLTDAGIYGERDHMRGISQSIMMGRTTYIGTGCCEAIQSKSDAYKTKQSVLKDDEVTRFGMLYPHQHRIAKSRFRGCKMVVDKIVSTPPVCRDMDHSAHEMALPSSSEIEAYGIDNMFIQSTGNFTSHCEPPYVDDSSFNANSDFLWPGGNASDKMPMLVDDSPQSMPSPTSNVPSDTAKIRKELIDVISRVPFNPPKSPLLMK